MAPPRPPLRQLVRALIHASPHRLSVIDPRKMGTGPVPGAERKWKNVPYMHHFNWDPGKQLEVAFDPIHSGEQFSYHLTDPRKLRLGGPEAWTEADRAFIKQKMGRTTDPQARRLRAQQAHVELGYDGVVVPPGADDPFTGVTMTYKPVRPDTILTAAEMRKLLTRPRRNLRDIPPGLLSLFE